MPYNIITKQYCILIFLEILLILKQESKWPIKSNFGLQLLQKGGCSDYPPLLPPVVPPKELRTCRFFSFSHKINKIIVSSIIIRLSSWYSFAQGIFLSLTVGETGFWVHTHNQSDLDIPLAFVVDIWEDWKDENKESLWFLNKLMIPKRACKIIPTK